MPRVGQVTSGEDGHFLWQLRDKRMSSEEGFYACSPIFSCSGYDYYMILQKEQNSYLVLASLHGRDGLKLPRVPLLLELRRGKRSASPSYAVTPDGRTRDVTFGVDFLSRSVGSARFPFDSVSLRMRPKGSFDSRGIQTDGLDSSSRDIDEKKFASQAIQTEVPDSSSRDTDELVKLQTDLETLVLSEEDSDVTLKVREKKFPAHRNILRSRSPVFAAMFGHDMAEKQSGDVTIEDCDPEAFPVFLHYIYTGSSEKVTEANVTHLFEISDKYEVLQLKALCGEFMKSHLSLETFCDFLTVAVRHREGDLVRAATEFFCENGMEIVQGVKWQVFLQNNPTVGNELFFKALSRGKTV